MLKSLKNEKLRKKHKNTIKKLDTYLSITMVLLVITNGGISDILANNIVFAAAILKRLLRAKAVLLHLICPKEIFH